MTVTESSVNLMTNLDSKWHESIFQQIKYIWIVIQKQMNIVH